MKPLITNLKVIGANISCTAWLDVGSGIFYPEARYSSDACNFKPNATEEYDIPICSPLLKRGP